MSAASESGGEGPRRTFLAVALTAVMVGSVVTAGVVMVRPASAAPQSVSSCTTIDEAGTYALTSDIDAGGETCIEITASDVTFDGNGHTVAGGGGATDAYGVYAHGDVSNVTVTDVTLTRWYIGAHLRGVSQSTASDIVAVDNKYYGFWVVQSQNTSVVDSIARDHTRGEGEGISVIQSHDLVFDNVTAVENEYGVHIDNNARDISFVDSTFARNGVWDYYMRGYADSDPANVTGTDVTIDNATIDIHASQNVVLRGQSELPAAPSEVPVGDYLRTSRAGGQSGSALNVSVHYDQSAVDGVDESSLDIWQYGVDGGEWSESSEPNYVDTEANTVTTDVDLSYSRDLLAIAGEEGSSESEPAPAPANFSVSGLDAPATVTQGDSVAVSATVENTGESEGTQTVEFVFDGEVAASEDVTLDAGASQSVSFDVPTEGVSAGTYTHGVFTDNGSATAELTVEAPEPEPEPAEFDVSELTAPTNVTAGETVTVNATVTNAGGTEATQTVEARIDADGDGTIETAVANRSVTLEPGESQTASVDVTIPEDTEPGTYAYGVFTEDDSATAEVTVEEPDPAPTASVTFDNQTTEGTTVTVDSVTMSDGGFVTIHASDGSVVGVSEYLTSGAHEDVEVTLFDVPGANYSDGTALEGDQTLIAMPHLDTDGDEVYDFVATGGEVDGPYTDDAGAVVDPAFVTVEDDEPAGPVYYQVDFAAGEPIENLSADSLYAQQDRLVQFAHGNTDEGITERGSAWASEEIREVIVEEGVIRADDGTAEITFTLAESADDVTMSLVTYTKPSAGFSADTAAQQELVASTTETFGPGTHTITVDLPDTDSEDDDSTADVTAGAVPVATA